MRDATHDDTPVGVDPLPRWMVESPVRLPTMTRLWREWRCGRKHRHGPDGFYLPVAIQTADGWRCWMQECQACGRFTCWSERVATPSASEADGPVGA